MNKYFNKLHGKYNLCISKSRIKVFHHMHPLILLFCGDTILADTASTQVEELTTTNSLWVAQVIPIASIVVGFLIVLLQLNRQHKNQLALQQENHKKQLLLEIHREFTKVSEKCSQITIDTGIYIYTIPSCISIYMSACKLSEKHRFQPKPVDKRTVVCNNKNSNLHISLCDVISLCEKYQIVHPELMEIFKLAMLSVSFDLDIAYRSLQNDLENMLPIDVPDKNGSLQTFNIKQYSEEEIDKLKQLVNVYYDKINEVQEYLYDLNIEIQKLFLGGHFPNILESRKPIDPSRIVITSEPENMKELKKYFGEESPRGKEYLKIYNATVSQYMHPTQPFNEQSML